MGNCICNEPKIIKKREVIVPITFDELPVVCSSLVNQTLKVKQDTGIVKKFLRVKTLKQGKSTLSSSGQPSMEISTECYIKMKSQKCPNWKESAYEEGEKVNIDKICLSKQTMDKHLSPSTNSQLNSENTTANNDIHLSQPEFSNVLMSEEEEEKLRELLKEHYLFHFFNDTYIQTIIDELTGVLIDSDGFIFHEGEESQCFFIIKSGKCLLISDNETCELNEYECFGELAISYEKQNSKRTYTIKALTPVELLWIDTSYYQSLRKTIQNLPTENDIISSFDNILLFDYLSMETKEKLASLVTFKKLPKGSKFISKNSKLNKENIYIILQGQISAKLSNGYTRYLYPGSCINVNQVLLFSNQDKKKYDVEVSEETICLMITKSSFIEVFGLPYQRHLLLQCFTKTINQNSFLSLVISKSAVTLHNLFKAFQIKEYNQNEIVFTRSSLHNKKYIFMFEGELMNNKNNEIVCEKGAFFGDEICLKSEE